FAWAAGAGLAASTLVILVSPGPLESFPHVANPTGVWALTPLFLVILTTPLGIVGAAVSLVQRYRRSRGTDRLQLKWLAAAAGGGGGGLPAGGALCGVGGAPRRRVA